MIEVPAWQVAFNSIALIAACLHIGILYLIIHRMKRRHARNLTAMKERWYFSLSPMERLQQKNLEVMQELDSLERLRQKFYLAIPMVVAFLVIIGIQYVFHW